LTSAAPCRSLNRVTEPHPTLFPDLRVVGQWLGQEGCLLGSIVPSGVPPEITPDGIRRALATPVWPAAGPTVFDAVRPGVSTCIVVSDQTRETRIARVLPFLFDGLAARGVAERDLFFLVATGVHRGPTDAELSSILGADVFRRFAGRIFIHDADDDRMLVEVGRTCDGQRVRLNRRAVEAGCLILTGTASYHYHAGFGGGRKALVPGLASRDTIAYNHSRTLDPTADRLHPAVEIGRLDGNPVAETMIECARMRTPDIIANTVLTPDDRLVGLFTGEMDAAHRAACRVVEQVSRVDVAQQADLVVASAGRAPNWIQSHKALFNACRAAKPGGRVVLLAPCPEGLGNERFRHFARMRDLAAIYRELRDSVEVNGQTALSTRIRGERAILVTRLDETDRNDLGIETARDAGEAVTRSIARLRDAGVTRPTCWLMPEAMHTVPFPAPTAAAP
jgi:nickel-dependent lactate racemase